jgi:DNA repair protein RecO (recombination protein O)
MNRAYPAEAIVLRRMPLGEADYLVTLYTDVQGKIKAVAKGARKPTGRQTGHVELYARTQLMLYRGRELHTITQAEVQDPHPCLQENLECSIYASHFTELIDQFSFEEEQNDRAYKLLVKSLEWLCQPDIDLRLLARFYEFHLLKVMGFEPMLFDCAIGGEELTPQNQYFSAVEGGIVCKEHGSGKDLMMVTLPTFKLLRHFSRSTWQQINGINVNERVHIELERVLHTYIIFLLERKLKSVGFLNHLKRLEKYGD